MRATMIVALIERISVIIIIRIAAQVVRVERRIGIKVANFTYTNS